MINVFGSKVGEEEIKQITDSINNQWMGMGPKTKLFETRMAERLQVDKFILVDMLLLATSKTIYSKSIKILLTSNQEDLEILETTRAARA